MKTCTTCGETKPRAEFDRPYSDSGWCKNCRKAHCRKYTQARRAKMRCKRTCIECGREWETANPNAKYCSNACQAAHEHGPDRRPKRRSRTRAERARAKLAVAAAGTHGEYVLTAGWCALCGATAIEGPGNVLGSVFYCSSRCRKTVRGKGLHPKISPALRTYIYRRDRGICHLCRKRVAMTRTAPHPRAPVLDHLVPLSLGGSNTRENLKLAHWLCNELKSNRPANEQLLLVG